MKTRPHPFLDARVTPRRPIGNCAEKGLRSSLCRSKAHGFTAFFLSPTVLRLMPI